MTCRTVRRPISKRRDVPDGMEKGHTPVLLSSRAALGGLQKRIDDAFPPKDYILRVYEALANYYQLGEGEGQGRAFEFNLKLFARNFKLNEARVMSAISILEVAGFLGYTTDINSRSRVMSPCYGIGCTSSRRVIPCWKDLWFS